MQSCENAQTSKTSVPASAMALISPNALLHAHLRQSPPLRPSGRAPEDSRPIDLNIGSLTHCNGSSLIKIGSTTIVCGLRAEILPVSQIASFRIKKSAAAIALSGKHAEEDSNDYDDIPLHHLVVPNLELATGCSPRHAANTSPSIEAQSISQRLLSLLHSSRLIRASDLQIIYQPPSEAESAELGVDQDPQLKAYWVLYIDMMCISYGGSIFDAAWLALYSTLKDTIIPQASWDADLEQIFCSPHIEDGRRLDLRGMPVPCSFGVFVPEKRLVQAKEERSWVLVDTDSFEEECCNEIGCITIDLGDKGKPSILRIEKNGGDSTGIGDIQALLKFAMQRWERWKFVLDSALNA